MAKEIKTVSDWYAEGARRGKHKRDSLCVVDVQESASHLADVLNELPAEQAFRLVHKWLNASRRRQARVAKGKG